MSLFIASLAAQGVGMGVNFLAQNRLKKQAEEASKRLQGANQQYLSDYQDVISAAENAPSMQIDRTLFDAMQTFAQNEALAVQGRAFGDEQMRDSVRQSVADQYARSADAATTGGDLLGAASDMTSAEQEALNKIDSSSIRNRFEAIQIAQERLLGASREKAVFNQKADLMEFNDRRRQEEYINELKLGQSRAQLEGTMGEISQDAAVGSAEAAMWSTLGGGLGSIGGSLMDLYTNNLNNEFLERVYKKNQPQTQAPNQEEVFGAGFFNWMKDQDVAMPDLPNFNFNFDGTID